MHARGEGRGGATEAPVGHTEGPVRPRERERDRKERQITEREKKNYPFEVGPFDPPSSSTLVLPCHVTCNTPRVKVCREQLGRCMSVESWTHAAPQHTATR